MMEWAFQGRLPWSDDLYEVGVMPVGASYYVPFVIGTL